MSSKQSAPAGPQFVRLSVAAPIVPTGGTPLVVEVGQARVRVAHGFDPVLLRAVVEALSVEQAS